MIIPVVDIVTPELVTETVWGEVPAKIEVRVVGNADGLAHGDLTVYLDELHRAALESNADEIIFDVRALEFMSASCLRSLAGWLGRLESTRTPRYLARFVSDHRKHWQRRSLETMTASYGNDIVRIDGM